MDHSSESLPTRRQHPVDPINDRNFPDDGSVRNAANYCRNPDRDPKGPWCFTGNRQPYETGYCAIPTCKVSDRDVPHKSECKSTVNGVDYDGFQSRTKSGKICQSWNSHVGVYPLTAATPAEPVTDQNFPEKSVLAARNYCRNPDRDSKGPWCFTGNRDPYASDFCNIPICGGFSSSCILERTDFPGFPLAIANSNADIFGHHSNNCDRLHLPVSSHGCLPDLDLYST